MDFRTLIAARRDGGVHTRQELEFLANGAAKGEIPDYQLAAWLMACYLKPLNDQETVDLTLSMANSGECLDLTGVPQPWVDKHSTGGVGDKTTLVLAPLLAACGLSVVKMSGRGLGITGGTIDKLESIPGFRSDLSPDELTSQAKKIGIALAGQTKDLAPADKALYALRDVTETVSSLPLIVSSILSKKIAGGANTIVLDVKCGSGSFNPTLDVAEKLADSLVRVGKLSGLKVYAAITDMDQPLGSTVGNALEVREAVEVLSKREDQLNSNTKRFRELCRYFAAIALRVSGQTSSASEALSRIEDTLNSGRALEKANQWIQAQGATVTFNDLSWLPVASHRTSISAGKAGYISRINARRIGEIALDLGAGRKTKADSIDHAAGIEILVKVGDFVNPEDVIAIVHSSAPGPLKLAVHEVSEAITIQNNAVHPRPILLRPA
jgi:pyrimidine-nucleoside phosphorylase